MYKDLPHPPSAYLPSPESPSSLVKGSKFGDANGNGHANGYNVNMHENGHANGHANGNGNGHGRDATDATYVHYEEPTKTTDWSDANKSVPYAFRSADGSDYNQLFPLMGAARKPYARTVPPLTPANQNMLPDAGTVFDALLCRRPTATHRLPSTNDAGSGSILSQFFSPSNNNGAESLSDAFRLPSSDPNAIPGRTSLPPTDASGFARHPGGISSLFFAFADLVIHSCFNTNHGDWSVNDASSYLDLSPLYGSGSLRGECFRTKLGFASGLPRLSVELVTRRCGNGTRARGLQKRRSG